jgi:hypothetical protein
VGVRKFAIESSSINDKEKNRFRSALLNTGGDSNASSSRVLKIFILAMHQTHQVKNVLELFIL